MTAASLRAPQAVLFDFGGVITDVVHVDSGFAVVARQLAQLVAGALVLADIEADLRAGSRAYESWKQSQSRRMHPRELSHAEFWELVTCDWPPGPRAAVLSDPRTLATLCQSFEHETLYRPAKPDSRAMLLALRERGIRTGLVSNCLSGDAERRQLQADRLTGLFDVELYSDETGRRKPDPEFLLQAVRAVGTEPDLTWFVGDKYNRDILAARRAGLGAAILMTSPGGPGSPVRGICPDLEIDSPTGLLALLE